MCVSPMMMPEVGPVSCRRCWQCRENRVNDYVGRAIAETKTATDTLALTLTYSGGDENSHAAVLVYSDVQNMLKRLRKAGFKVRYMCAGEYGSVRGRAHWHIVLFFYGAVPQIEREERVSWSFWTNEAEGRGFVYCEKPDFHGFRYILKYAIKDQKKEVSTSHFAFSTSPPLGAEYFRQLADRYVDQGLVPQDYFYSFPELRKKDGTHEVFQLQGVMRERFMSRFLDQWALKRPAQPFYEGEVIEKHFEKIGFNDAAYQHDKLIASIQSKDANWSYVRPVVEVRPTAFELCSLERDDFGRWSVVVRHPDRLEIVWQRGLGKFADVKSALRGQLVPEWLKPRLGKRLTRLDCPSWFGNSMPLQVGQALKNPPF